MPLLKLKQHIEQEDQYRVEIAFRDDDGTEQSPETRFEYQMTREDRADLRWYLEDYLQYPMDPAPEIAARVEARLHALGTELFQKVFQANDDTRDLWATLRARLDDTRVEVVTDIKGATALPWELLLDPKTDASLALRARSFVRAYAKPAQKVHKPQTADKVRILLVICRPGGDEDVPFRSVAGQLIKGLGEEAREHFQLDVLRPPTFEQLSKTLHNAKSEGQPYHIVHFDGHGGYFDAEKLGGGSLSRTIFGGRTGSHGYLAFENPKLDNNLEWIDGPSLGKLLVETDAPVLVLNACRSAHAAPLDEPDVAREVDESHSQVRAFGSLAQEVMDAGVAGVVAMRYNVYVVTAAQFVADLYAALASGQGLGEAVSLGRKQLAAQPLREIAFEPIALQDWSVPVVYEALPIQLFPSVGATHASPLQIDLSKTEKVDDLPRPEIGFFGRDETLLALDRAYDTEKVVLLHAYAGGGKTMTAAEFARWYEQTGGLSAGVRATHASPLPGTILFTSFEQYKPLERVLDTVEQEFGSLLQANNIHWLAMDADARLNITLQIFKQIPVLWIWDNIEPVNGFPAGTASAWTEAEQRELKTFLQIVTAQTRAKFLLTSRREERAWLGDLPRRITLPPMPVQERVQMARALAEKHNRRISDVDDWMPLLKFTGGNPLTITVLVGQALRDGIKTKNQVLAFVQKLRSGETAFEDETSEGRTKSLGASLSYGFETAFSPDERKVLALLHFFQGFVDVDALVLMGNPKAPWHLPELEHLTRDTGTQLLDKASEIGLLTPHGNGYYTIHPALPWFFRGEFEMYYQTEDEGQKTETTSVLPLSGAGRPSSSAALRAFVESMGGLGDYYANQYEYGDRDVIGILRAEEPNLLHARALARKHEMWNPLIGTMQGLQTLYDHTGRRAEWKRLVMEIIPDFVGADDLPILGREEQWRFVNDYRVRLSQESRDWQTAERLQHNKVDYARRKAADLLQRPAGSLDAGEKNSLRSLAVSIEQLGNIQREQGKAECADSYKETIPICQKIGDKTEEAVLAFNLGQAYQDLPALRNLDEAERWYKRDLELENPKDYKGRAQTLGQLGILTHERFNDAKKEGKTKEELVKHLNSAVDYYQQALALLPPDAVNDLAVTHNQLGIIYRNAGDLERALEHYNQSINYKERAGDIYGAGTTRRNIAIALADNGRLSDALLYARSALRNFEPYGQGAAKDIENTKYLIGEIERLMKK